MVMEAIDSMFSRFKDAPYAGVQLDVTLGGAGGLGSHVAYFLSRLRHNVVIYDFDTVGGENIGGGQWFKISQIGKTKTSALINNMKEFSGRNNRYIGMGKFDEESEVTDVCIATFDNMEARKLMAEKWYHRMIEKKKAKIDGVFLFIDGRMYAEGGQIWSINNPRHFREYMDLWEPSDAIPEAPCTFKSTTHNAAMIAANIIAVLNNKVTNKMVGGDLMEVPLKIETEIKLFASVNEEYLVR